ncbi:hypothetical protein [Novosphingobium malaysiense]|uniref:DUF1214 domain-containing protein n=1 Tax=Novosphingobium malaysiense TaxID=1348853 RepID=A0A0B1ZLQ2_9SPHN|nr:hypothetical protein [Novosphingobium malaysiense]KHK90269.1 hypothetical protein LK12_16695 [Novosphingobium malaysiense]
MTASELAHSAYFLSSRNPVANADQRDLEQVALRLRTHPAVERARKVSGVLWRNVMAWPAAEQMDRFEEAIDEVVFNFVLRAVNSDGHYPRVLRKMQPAHRWFGHDMPGSRWGGDSPDFCYRLIPIEHGGRYLVTATPTCERPPSVTFTLMKNMPSLQTVGLLDSLDLKTESDGRLIITIDERPERVFHNHLQTTPGDMHLLVRDAQGDWLAQTPWALRVEKLDGPQRDPLGDDALAREAARQIMESMYYVYYCTQSGSGQAPNELRAPASSAAFGGMATQWGSKSNVVLAPDEALIVTTTSAGATFRNTSLCDMFFQTVNYWSRTGSLNADQMAADADGRFTYVVAHQDPGVHNWLDTGGRRRTIFGHRWQAFERGKIAETPTISSRLVKFSDLERELDSRVVRIDSAGRKAQIAARMEGFASRFIDD